MINNKKIIRVIWGENNHVDVDSCFNLWISSSRPNKDSIPHPHYPSPPAGPKTQWSTHSNPSQATRKMLSYQNTPTTFIMNPRRASIVFELATNTLNVDAIFVITPTA